MLRRHSFLSDYDGKVSFEPGEFLADNFSVDEFIQNKRTRVPLDVLRDDLGSHLKFLRSSLIELINQDYGQFVNLSSNLVGLDGRIQNIAGPLQRAKNDLGTFIGSMDSEIEALKQELKKKTTIRQIKRQLQLHKMAILAIESSEKHMRKVPFNLDSSCKTEADLQGLSSTCEEIANAQFLLQNCEESPMSCNAKKRLDTLMSDALSRMNLLLVAHSSSGLNGESKLIIKTLFRLYLELQKVSEAERIFSLNVLKPVCDEILSKRGNISSLLDEVERFLLQSPAIQVSSQLDTYTWMSNYALLTNCVLPQVIGILKKHFPHIWSPSNPDLFHGNWIRCQKFIGFLEEQMPSVEHLVTFRDCEVLKEFIAKWQFPVYFQLRFHALAIELEQSLEEITTPCANADFKLDATRVLVKVLKQCWDPEKIYISHISGRFLKASALIVSRYIKAIEDELSSSSSKSETPIDLLLNIYCDLKLAELIVQQMIAEKLDPSSPKLPSPQPSSSPSPAILSFFQDFRWQQTRDYVENRLVQLTMNDSSSSISQVTEIPRLYRRTNREVPTRHGDYVEGILKPIQALQTTVQSFHQGQLWDNVGVKICSQITQRYKSQVDEVLTSVLRMEESLKRLKKVKGQSVGASDNKALLSDDDKIRKQIHIDISYFSNQVNSICPSVDTTPLNNIFDKTNGTS